MPRSGIYWEDPMTDMGWTVSVFSATCFPSTRTKPSIAIMWSTSGNSFIGLREKEWLLTVGGVPRKMLAYPRTGKPGTKPIRSTLYHLTDDPKEKVNVHDQYPEVVQRMERILEKEKAKTLLSGSGSHDKP
jgi:hypothetical protein